jgi:hypothetical protein
MVGLACCESPSVTSSFFIVTISWRFEFVRKVLAVFRGRREVFREESVVGH